MEAHATPTLTFAVESLPAVESHERFESDPEAIRRVIAWMGGKPAELRADAISALTRSYVNSPLPDGARADVVLAMTAALDDESLLVRRSLAEGLASAGHAPPHILMTLAGDRSEVARIVLARSPGFDDAALAEAARNGDVAVQTAIARRHDLGPRAVHALAETGERAAVAALIHNARVLIGGEGLRLAFDRFPNDIEIAEALAVRDGLPATLKVDLALAKLEHWRRQLAADAEADPRRAARLARDARERAIIVISRDCRDSERLAVVDHLRERAYLTPGLLMRALMGGDRSLFEATLSCMARVPVNRVAGFLAQSRGHGFASLYNRCGLPAAFLPAFRIALGALASAPQPLRPGAAHMLTLNVIDACEALGDPELAPMIAMLWRLAGESAREEARILTAEIEPLAAPTEALAQLKAPPEPALAPPPVMVTSISQIPPIVPVSAPAAAKAPPPVEAAPPGRSEPAAKHEVDAVRPKRLSPAVERARALIAERERKLAAVVAAATIEPVVQPVEASKLAAMPAPQIARFDATALLAAVAAPLVKPLNPAIAVAKPAHSPAPATPSRPPLAEPKAAPAIAKPAAFEWTAYAPKTSQPPARPLEPAAVNAVKPEPKVKPFEWSTYAPKPPASAMRPAEPAPARVSAPLALSAPSGQSAPSASSFESFAPPRAEPAAPPAKAEEGRFDPELEALLEALETPQLDNARRFAGASAKVPAAA